MKATKTVYYAVCDPDNPIDLLCEPQTIRQLAEDGMVFPNYAEAVSFARGFHRWLAKDMGVATARAPKPIIQQLVIFRRRVHSGKNQAN